MLKSLALNLVYFAGRFRRGGGGSERVKSGRPKLTELFAKGHFMPLWISRIGRAPRKKKDDGGVQAVMGSNLSVILS